MNEQTANYHGISGLTNMKEQFSLSTDRQTHTFFQGKLNLHSCILISISVTYSTKCMPLFSR